MNRVMVPTIGAHVLTSDGKELGNVKEVMGDCFKVDVALQPDYWLSTDTIATSSIGEVRLRFPKEGIKTVQHDGPGHTGFHAHS